MSLLRPGMGTENAGALLATLVTMCRPSTIVEIGAGDSTLALATALRDAHAEWEADLSRLRADRWEERTALLDPTQIPDTYEPTLITIDDFSGDGSSAEAAWSRLETAGVTRRWVTFVQQDFFSLTTSVMDGWGPVDLAWVDAGTPMHDVRFVAELWGRVRPGGYLCLHEPTMLTHVRGGGTDRLAVVRTPVWEELCSRLDGSYELLTVPEPHKYRQSGLGVLRKRTAAERPVRAQSLQRELLALGEPPVRNDLLAVPPAARAGSAISSVLEVLRDEQQRRAYAAIVLGHHTLRSISTVAEIPPKAVGRVVNRLLAAGLVHADGDGVHESPGPWEGGTDLRGRDRTNLPDAALEERTTLELIVEAFDQGRPYAEAEVSRTCSLFTTDFARLRRRLVDDGLLARDGVGTYTRPVG